MSDKFLIKHLSSGKFFHPRRGGSNPGNDTGIVLHQDIHKNMHWTFEKVTDHWGYIKHVSSGKVIHPKGGNLQPGNDTKLVLHSDRHWGALFALDGANDHVIHKGGRFAHPKGGSPNPGNDTDVVLHSDVHDAMRFQFVSTNNPIKEVLVYGAPLMVGEWKIISMIQNPAAEHRGKLEIKVGKSTTETRTSSFQYRWEMTGGIDTGLVQASASQSVQLMFENSSSETWTNETTRTREIIVKPGKTVVTWQYVFNIQQNESSAVHQSNLLADTDSPTDIPDDLHYVKV